MDAGLPTTLWHFDRIAEQDPARAEQLQAAPSCERIFEQCQQSLATSLARGQLRVGFDEAGPNAADLRAVLQFAVAQQLFDCFFNAHTGYRGQFRLGWANGLARNEALIEQLRVPLASAATLGIAARRLSSTFEDRGPEPTSITRVLESLDPYLSKVWFCKRLLHHDGQVTALRVELSGPRLPFDDYDSWASVIADEGDCWLDVKGAFLGSSGLYQLKDPAKRAKDMQRDGTA
jgi:hypothetical protein